MSSSHFAHSHNVLYDNTFITASNYHAHGVGRSRSDKAFDLLCENIAAEAIHNSDERCDAPKVHPETRKAVQEEIFGWITDGDHDAEPKNILWLSGPAGSGKTAIAGTIAELCEDQGLLAGSFFFSSYSGSEKRRSKRWVVATLAYCLLQHRSLDALREHILSVIERDPTIFRKSLRDQCKALLLRPFHNALSRLDLSALPKVIILDGLDEVEGLNSRQLEDHEARLANEADQVEILSTLLHAADDPKFPFRVIVVSRPERVITEFFSTKADHISRKTFLDEKYDPDSDIALFLRAKLAGVRRRYGITATWPGKAEIERLVANASGQFIYAATVIRYLESGKRPNPQAILRTILDTSSSDSSLDVLAHLDALYTRILMSSPDPRLALRWIRIIDLPQTHGGRPFPARFTRQLYQDHEGQAEYLLENLASLIDIPAGDDQHSPYRFYHKSMLDFLSSARRCGKSLKKSYDAGIDFLIDRWYGVLKAKSPVVPLGDLDWPIFVKVLWDTFSTFQWTRMRAFRCPYVDLSLCDVVGWVRILSPLHTEFDEFTPSTAGYIFGRVHVLCRDRGFENVVTHCSKECRHWRAGMLGEYKRMGWRVPTTIDLLLERFDKNTPVWVSPLCFSFNPLGNIPPLELPPACVATPGLSDRMQADYDEYEAQCAVVETIYQALPNDWRDPVRKVGHSVKSATKNRIRAVVASQLDRIAPEVRRQMNSLDVWILESYRLEEEEREKAESYSKEYESHSEGYETSSEGYGTSPDGETSSEGADEVGTMIGASSFSDERERWPGQGLHYG